MSMGLVRASLDRAIRRISLSDSSGLALILLILLAACAPAVQEDVPHSYLPLVSRPETNITPTWWRPAPGVSWQWQLSISDGDPLDTTVEAQMYDIDLFETSEETIAALHTTGRVVICYFSAGSWEDWRPDAGAFASEVLGQALDGWPGERWLDIRRRDLLAAVMLARLDLAAHKGCDGVEPDNVDGYVNDSGFDLSAADQLAYNRWLAEQAHARGLSVGLKNDLEQVPELLPNFDWALNEQCFQYNECEKLLPFIAAGKAVFGVEYELDAEAFCPQANQMDFDFLQKHWALDAWRVACRP